MTEEELAALQARRGGLAVPSVKAPTKQTLHEVHQAKGRLKDGEPTKLEQRYMEHLNRQMLAGAIKWWRFEFLKVHLAKRTHLTIDFYVLTDLNELQAHDTKAHRKAVTDDALAKTKIAAEMSCWPYFYAYEREDGGWDLERIGR